MRSLRGTGKQRGGTDDYGLGTGEVLIPLGEMRMFARPLWAEHVMFCAIFSALFFTVKKRRKFRTKISSGLR